MSVVKYSPLFELISSGFGGFRFRVAPAYCFIPVSALWGIECERSNNFGR